MTRVSLEEAALTNEADVHLSITHRVIAVLIELWEPAAHILHAVLSLV